MGVVGTFFGSLFRNIGNDVATTFRPSRGSYNVNRIDFKLKQQERHLTQQGYRRPNDAEVEEYATMLSEKKHLGNAHRSFNGRVNKMSDAELDDFLGSASQGLSKTKKKTLAKERYRQSQHALMTQKYRDTHTINAKAEERQVADQMFTEQTEGLHPIIGKTASTVRQLDQEINEGLENTVSLVMGAVGDVSSNLAFYGRQAASPVAKAVGQVVAGGVRGGAGVGFQTLKPMIKHGAIGAYEVGKVGAIAVGATGYVAGKAGMAIGKEAFSFGSSMAKGVYATRNSTVAQVGAAALGVGVIAPAVSANAEHKADYSSKLQMVNVSQDGGGTFFYGAKSPGRKVTTNGRGYDNLGAEGNLVFALHNLRNGGW